MDWLVNCWIGWALVSPVSKYRVVVVAEVGMFALLSDVQASGTGQALGVCLPLCELHVVELGVCFHEQWFATCIAVHRLFY